MQRSAAAVVCETAAIGMREENRRVLRYGVGVAARLVGMRFTDEQALVSAKVAATRQAVGVLADDLAAPVDLQIMSRGIASGRCWPCR